MRALSAASVKNVSWRSRARIHRSAISTAASIFALSRGFAGRAGRMAVPIVLGELLVRALQARLVAARHDDAALELVAHDGGGDPAKEGEGPLMAGDPVRDLLRPGRLGVGVVRGAEDGDEELDLDHLARRRVDDPRLLAGVVDEALVAGVVDLAHRQPAPLQPAAVELAELRVAVAVGMLLEILEVEQFEGDAGLAPLGVEIRAVRDGPMVRGRCREPVEHAPPAPSSASASTWAQSSPACRARDDRGSHGPTADPQAPGHLPVTPAQDPLLAKDLSGLSHGQSLGRHSLPFWDGWPVRRPASLGSGHPPRRGCPTGGGDHDAPIRVITMPISGSRCRSGDHDDRSG